MIKFFRDIFGSSENNNTLGPPLPNNLCTLLVETPENICSQYLSMEEKTRNLFNTAKSKNSFKDFCNASMRLASYSTVAIHGMVLFLACIDNNVTKIIPKKYNKLVYSDFLIDIYNFSWVMLQHCLFNSEYVKNTYDRKKIISFLESEIAATAFPNILMMFVAPTPANSEYAEKIFKEEIQLMEQYGENIEDFPTEKTKQSFDELVAATLIGDPNTFQSFNASYQVQTFSDLDLVTDIGNKIRNTILYENLFVRVETDLK